MMSYPSSQTSRRQAGELLRFVLKGNLRRVERELDGGANIDGVGSNPDFPPLVLAAEGGLVKMAKLLLRKGADVNVAAPRDIPRSSHDEREGYRIISGTTALHAAVHHRWLGVVRLLVRSGGNPNAADSDGATALHLACDNDAGDATIMASTLLEVGADPLLADTCGELAIHFAAAQGHIDLVNMLLLKAPTTLNRPSSEGSTPLCFAAMNGRVSMVLHLLRLGAYEPVTPDKQITSSPLAAAVKENHGEVLRILLHHGMDAVHSTEAVASAMESAISSGRAKLLHAMLGGLKGDDMRRCLARWRKRGLPALHYAVVQHRLATVGVLLAAGADETAVDNGGRLASEVVGSEDYTDPGTTAAVLRMLERGPAFRAASWKWPPSMGPPVSGTGGTMDALPGGRRAGPLFVSIFRLRSKKKAFVRLVGRFAT